MCATPTCRSQNGTFPVMAPTVLGHEAAGVVEAVGDGVTDLAVGDKVVLSPIAACNAVLLVRARRVRLLRQHRVRSSTGHVASTVTRRCRARRRRCCAASASAASPSYVITPTSGAIKVADDTPLEIVCVIGCAVQTGVGAVLNTAKVPEGATVLVRAAAASASRSCRARASRARPQIILVRPVAERREAAAQFGATDVIDPTKENVAIRAHELTNGIGVDYAFDAVGLGSLVERACSRRATAARRCWSARAVSTRTSRSPAAVMYVTERKLMGSFLGRSYAAATSRA